jgi:hypothetical protein
MGLTAPVATISKVSRKGFFEIVFDQKMIVPSNISQFYDKFWTQEGKKPMLEVIVVPAED